MLWRATAVTDWVTSSLTSGSPRGNQDKGEQLLERRPMGMSMLAGTAPSPPATRVAVTDRRMVHTPRSTTAAARSYYSRPPWAIRTDRGTWGFRHDAASGPAAASYCSSRTGTPVFQDS